MNAQRLRELVADPEMDLSPARLAREAGRSRRWVRDVLSGRSWRRSRAEVLLAAIERIQARRNARLARVREETAPESGAELG